MVNAKVSHHRGDRWFLISEEALQGLICALVRSHKGGLFGIDSQAQGA